MGVAGVGSGDRAHQPADHRRPVLEAAAGAVHDRVLAVRQGAAGSVAGRRAGRGVGRGGDGVQARVAPHPRPRRRDHRARRCLAPPRRDPAAAGGAGRGGQPGQLGRVRLQQRAGLLRGAGYGAGTDRGRQPPRRSAPPGVRGGVLRRARPTRAVVRLGAVRPVSVLARSGSPQAGRRPVRADPDPLVPARAVGLRTPAARGHPRPASALQQRRLHEVPGLHRVPQRGVADRDEPDQDPGHRRDVRRGVRAVAHARRMVAPSGSGRPSRASPRVGPRPRLVRLRVVAGSRGRDPGGVLGQQPVPGAGDGAGGDRGRRRVGLVRGRAGSVPTPSGRAPGGSERADPQSLHAPGRGRGRDRPHPPRTPMDRREREHRQPAAHPPRARLPGTPARGPDRRRERGRGSRLRCSNAAANRRR